MKRPDYPLLLKPHLAERVWGGLRLGRGIGEAWDLSVHPHGPSAIRNGPLEGETLAAVAEAHPGAFGGPIGILAKRLDCREPLSVQVHPPEEKTEAWVVLEADEGAGVWHGFSRDVTREELEGAARDGAIEDLLRFVPARRGDVIFVPGGTVHAIGGGLLLFEIQQSADTTWRLWDWGRGREVHVEKAAGCADLVTRPPHPPYEPLPTFGERILRCEHFFVDRMSLDDAWELHPGDAWKAVFVLGGKARTSDAEVAKGETMLLPAAAGPRRLLPSPRCDLLLYGP